MGTNTLTAGVDGNVIPATIINQYKEALQDNVVPRNSSAVPTDIAGDLGTSSFRWKNAYLEQIILGLVASGLSIDESSGAMQFNVASNQQMKIATNLLSLFDNVTIGNSSNVIELNVANAAGEWKLNINSVEHLAMKTSGLEVKVGGVLKALINSTGMHGQYLTAASVGTTELENLAITEAILGNLSISNGKLQDLSISTGKLQNSCVTDIKTSKNYQKTNTVSTWTTSSTSDQFLETSTGSGTNITKTFQASSASAIVSINCFPLLTAGSSATIVTNAATAEISCFRDGTEIGRQTFSNRVPASSIRFYDEGSTSTRTYTFKVKSASAVATTVENCFFILSQL